MAGIEKSKDRAKDMVRYGCEEVKLYGEKSAKLKNAFFDPAIGKFLETKGSSGVLHLKIPSTKLRNLDKLQRNFTFRNKFPNKFSNF